MTKTRFTPSRLALAISAVLAAVPVAAAETESDDNEIERIEVTASRRLTSTSDIPYNISVLDGDALSDAGIGNVAELGYTIPGLTVIDTGPRNDKPMAMRGLTLDEMAANDQGGNGGTVSVYVNDTPMLVDLKMIDVNRVEVLRGPQGTLYGAGSLGGTLRYILNKPELATTEGYAGARIYQTKESESLSNEVYGALNMPLVGDKLAVRVAASRLDDAGFVDYPLALSGPIEDADDEQTFSGRVAVRYAPTDSFDATLTYLSQDQEVGGRSAVNPEFTGNDYDSALRYDEPLDRVADLTSLEFSWDLNAVTLSSSSSYTTLEEQGQRDQTDLLVTAIWPGYADYPEFSAYTREDVDREVFTQELRLTSNSDGPLLWLLGGYYSNEDNVDSSKEFTPGYPEFIGMDRPDELEYYSSTVEDVEEVAAFGEVTYKFTDKWDATLGGRAFSLTQDATNCLDFPIYEGVEGTALTPECTIGEGKNEDFIGKASTFYYFTDDVNAFLLYSQGFRRGGSNGVPEGGQVSFTEDEKSYDPDTVDNYELGWHSEWLDGDLSVNGALYYIEWHDIQVAGKTAEGSIPITENGGEARSQGVEMEIAYNPFKGLLLQAGYAYTNAELTEDAPSLDGFDGDRVPGVPEHEGALSATYSHSIKAVEARYFIGTYMKSEVYTRVNDRAGTKNEDNQVLPGFGIVNASASFGYDEWLFRLYADNLFDKYAKVGARGARDYGEQGQFYYINKPLTVGAEVQYKF